MPLAFTQEDFLVVSSVLITGEVLLHVTPANQQHKNGSKSNFSPSYIYRPHPKDGGRYCFQFVSPHLNGGGDSILPDWDIPSFPTGGTPSFLTGGTPIRTGWGYPLLGLDGGIPPSGLDGFTPPPPSSQETEQQSDHFLRGGRYASCVHAGLYCLCLKTVVAFAID